MRKGIISNSVIIIKVKIPMTLNNTLKQEKGGKEIAISATIPYPVLLVFPGKALGQAVSVRLHLPHLWNGATYSVLENIALKQLIKTYSPVYYQSHITFQL